MTPAPTLPPAVAALTPEERRHMLDAVLDEDRSALRGIGDYDGRTSAALARRLHAALARLEAKPVGVVRAWYYDGPGGPYVASTLGPAAALVGGLWIPDALLARVRAFIGAETFGYLDIGMRDIADALLRELDVPE